jgi:hypothetical protein
MTDTEKLDKAVRAEARAIAAILVEVLEQGYPVAHRDFMNRIGMDYEIVGRVKALRSRLHPDVADYQHSPLSFRRGSYA